MSIHDGHRERLKKRFTEEGLDNFEEVNVLELLLFYCIPRRDTNPIAHALLDRFETLVNVLDAPVEELEKVDGISHHAATFLKLSTAVNKYYMVKRQLQTPFWTVPKSMEDFWCPKSTVSETKRFSCFAWMPSARSCVAGRSAKAASMQPVFPSGRW